MPLLHSHYGKEWLETLKHRCDTMLFPLKYLLERWTLGLLLLTIGDRPQSDFGPSRYR